MIMCDTEQHKLTCMIMGTGVVPVSVAKVSAAMHSHAVPIFGLSDESHCGHPVCLFAY